MERAGQKRQSLFALQNEEKRQVVENGATDDAPCVRHSGNLTNFTTFLHHPVFRGHFPFQTGWPPQLASLRIFGFTTRASRKCSFGANWEITRGDTN